MLTFHFALRCTKQLHPEHFQNILPDCEKASLRFRAAQKRLQIEGSSKISQKCILYLQIEAALKRVQIKMKAQTALS
jgi:hypothetical protein